MLKADLIQKEIDRPIDGWCSSGHKAPEMFKRQGPDGPEEPTKFFKLSSDNISGIYCEPCLIVAHFVAAQKKKLGK